jgi:two-component system phosphate regulon sensor histidine kinase PhoR
MYLQSNPLCTAYLASGLLSDADTTAATISVLIGAGLFAAVMLIILLMSSRSLRDLRRAAERFAQGDLSQHVAVKGPLQLAALAESLNQMAQQLQERLATVIQQRNELGAVLSSMVEGVLAIDLDQRIISLNVAAASLLKLQPDQAIGQPLQHVVANTALLAFAERSLREDASIQDEFVFDIPQQTERDSRHLQVQSAILKDGNGEHIGAVIVLHDITRLRRLEAVRRDFVANVSHEVKTPVAAIKAAVETILDGPACAPDTDRFLRIIARQADRLAAIVEDLLSLARIEQGAEQIAGELQLGALAPVLSAACETCQSMAEEKKIDLHVQCDPSLAARINAPLLEQAVINLIDNAVKYSPAGTQVLVVADRSDGAVVIGVTDQGRGIEPQHLPRIFERFYRTDKARSRALGGTGLGLSIVKHVAEAHGGRVSVESQPGSGSTFRIHLRTTDSPLPVRLRTPG